MAVSGFLFVNWFRAFNVLMIPIDWRKQSTFRKAAKYERLIMSNQGMATCSICGAEYRMFTINNKNLQGLCKAWRDKHEKKCKERTAKERRKWAKPYEGKDRYESSIVVDLTHSAFKD